MPIMCIILVSHELSKRFICIYRHQESCYCVAPNYYNVVFYKSWLLKFKMTRKTIFCDIDGTIFKHQNTLNKMLVKAEILPGVMDKFLEWRKKEYYIVLTTARPRGCRKTTENQLLDFGLFFDELIMGLPSGPRILINDTKPNGTITSYAVSLDRDTGFQNLEV